MNTLTISKNVGWVSSLFERNTTKNVGLRSKSELTQPTPVSHVPQNNLLF